MQRDVAANKIEYIYLPPNNFNTMKRALIFFSILCAIISCQRSNNFQSVDVDSFAQIIQDQNVVILDVRCDEEFLNGHIPNAITIDVRNSNFKEEALERIPKDRTIALYCRSGKRSKIAARKLASEGYKVIELNTGFDSWKGKIEFGFRGCRLNHFN